MITQIFCDNTISTIFNCKIDRKFERFFGPMSFQFLMETHQSEFQFLFFFLIFFSSSRSFSFQSFFLSFFLCFSLFCSFNSFFIFFCSLFLSCIFFVFCCTYASYIYLFIRYICLTKAPPTHFRFCSLDSVPVLFSFFAAWFWFPPFLFIFRNFLWLFFSGVCSAVTCLSSKICFLFSLFPRLSFECSFLAFFFLVRYFQ